MSTGGDAKPPRIDWGDDAVLVVSAMKCIVGFSFVVGCAVGIARLMRKPTVSQTFRVPLPCKSYEHSAYLAPASRHKQLIYSRANFNRAFNRNLKLNHPICNGV